MSFIEIKGRIVFWLFVIAIIFSLFSGEFKAAGALFLYLVAGMVFYQVMRAFFSFFIGKPVSYLQYKKLKKDLRNEEIKRREAENPFACDQCRKRFKLESALLEHKKSKHNKRKNLK